MWQPTGRNRSCWTHRRSPLRPSPSLSTRAVAASRAANAKSVADRHTSAWALWEAAIKTLGAAAVGTFAADPSPNPRITAQMRNLARPSLGDWVEVAARRGPAPGRPRGRRVPRPARSRSPPNGTTTSRGPPACPPCSRSCGERPTSRATVSLAELLDHLVDYRNDEVGHGVGGHRAVAVRDRVGRRWSPRSRRCSPPSTSWLAAGWCTWTSAAATGQRGPSAGWSLFGRARTGCPSGHVGRRGPIRPARGYTSGRPPGTTCRCTRWGVSNRRLSRRTSSTPVAAAPGSSTCATPPASTSTVRSSPPTTGTSWLRCWAFRLRPPQADQWAAESLAGEPAARAPAAEVRRLGEFEIEGELGRGGMGIVYRARQPSLDRAVAVKRLFCSGKPEAEKRFAREIRALGHVEHPHLVKVYTSGSDADQWFYAMELVDGVPLSVVCQTLSASSLSPEAVDRAAWQAAVSTACSTDYPRTPKVGYRFRRKLPNRHHPRRSYPCSPGAASVT